MNLPAKIGTGVLVSAAAGWVFIQNRWLTTDKYEVTVPGLPKEFDGKKILHLSDLHKKRYGDGFNNLINSCRFLDPDYIFFTGDLFSRDETNLDPKILLMQRLMKIAPVYYVLGNHEGDAPDRALVLSTKLSEEGIHVLNSRTERIELDGAHINVTGAVLPQTHYHCEGYSNRTVITPELLKGLVGSPEKGTVTFLLAHDPLPFRAYAEWGADLTFSGHVHGGIVRLPFIGGVLSPERKFFPEYSKGVYRLGDSQMVVSAGLGKFRLHNPSQIILVTLKSR
ncbi:hypothetical protein SAMN02910317_00213 [Ruminococcaceae bacterium FB2012]|nr:hypothetical protein SAMN02910317_00213 [Ruminococcaceae bacterium FB2012]